jgi:hypothetical protein
VVPGVCSADPKGLETSSQGILGYISVLSSLKSTYFYVLLEIIAEVL